MWSSWVFKLVIPGSAVRRSHERNVVVLGSLDMEVDDLTRVMWSSWVFELVIPGSAFRRSHESNVVELVFKLVIPGSAVRRSHERNVVELGIQACNAWICSQTISRE